MGISASVLTFLHLTLGFSWTSTRLRSMSVFDPPLTFVNNDEDNYQQATDSDGSNDGESGLLSNSHKSKSNKNGKNGDKSNENDNDNDNESSKTSVLTRTKSISHHIRWEIDDRSIQIAKLATKADKRGVIEATVIKDGYDFKLELCASGWRSSQDGYCAFYLTVPNMTDTFVARYRVQFGSTSRVSSIRHDFQLGVGFPNFCHQDTLDSCLDNKVCIFNIVIEIFNCESTIKLPLTPLTVKQPDCVLAQLMRQIYNNRLHCDVKLMCHGKVIKAHKVILSHASPVFKAMFTHNLYENNRNEVSMLEWDPCIVEAFIKYLYTATIDIRTDHHSKQFRKGRKRLIKSSSYSIDNNNMNNNDINYFKPHPSFYTASTKSNILSKGFQTLRHNNENDNNINNNNIINNDGMNSNESVLGLDESGIDESKTWAYNEMFEKKENSLIPRTPIDIDSDNDNNNNDDVSSDSDNDNDSDRCNGSSDDGDCEDNYESDENSFESSSECINNRDEKEKEIEMVDDDNTGMVDSEGERFENTSSDKDHGELDEMELDKNDSDNITNMNKTRNNKTKKIKQQRIVRSMQSAHTQTSLTRASSLNIMLKDSNNIIDLNNNNNSNDISNEKLLNSENSDRLPLFNGGFDRFDKPFTLDDIVIESDENNNDNNNGFSNGNSLIATPERRVINGNITNDINDNNDNNNGVIDTTVVTVSFVDMSEQAVGSPCASRLRKVKTRSKSNKSNKRITKRINLNNKEMSESEIDNNGTGNGTGASARKENEERQDSENDNKNLLTFSKNKRKHRSKLKEKEKGYKTKSSKKQNKKSDKKWIKSEELNKNKRKRKNKNKKRKRRANNNDIDNAMNPYNNNGNNGNNNSNNNNFNNISDNKNDFGLNKRLLSVQSIQSMSTFGSTYNSNYSHNSYNSYNFNNALSNDLTFKLFEIGEFYKVSSLVISCCQKMHREIKISTACDLLIRIHKYEHVKELKDIQESVWIFVSDNIRDVMKTAGYKFILAHYPQLLGQLIEKITH